MCGGRPRSRAIVLQQALEDGGGAVERARAPRGRGPRCGGPGRRSCAARSSSSSARPAGVTESSEERRSCGSAARCEQPELLEPRDQPRAVGRCTRSRLASSEGVSGPCASTVASAAVSEGLEPGPASCRRRRRGPRDREAEPDGEVEGRGGYASLISLANHPAAYPAAMGRAEERVRECLARIEAREGELRAWAYLDADAALAQARARDAEAPRGPLHGLPVGVKDVIDTADMPTAYGSPIYDGHRPERDADCVAWLREQGAVILGKTVTTEFATYQPPVTVNPHDPERTPGGSSSGSAAAVAAGWCRSPTARRPPAR